MRKPKIFNPEIRIKSHENQEGIKIYWAEFKAQNCFFCWRWYKINSFFIGYIRKFTPYTYYSDPFENREYCKKNAEKFIRYINKLRFEKWDKKNIKNKK